MAWSWTTPDNFLQVYVVTLPHIHYIEEEFRTLAFCSLKLQIRQSLMDVSVVRRIAHAVKILVVKLILKIC